MSVITPGPLHLPSQLACFHQWRRALMLERTAATTLPALQSQRRSHCACRPAVLSTCIPSSPCKAIDQAQPWTSDHGNCRRPAPLESCMTAFAPHLSMQVDAGQCVSMRVSMHVNAASRCPLVSLCRNSQSWPAYSCNYLRQSTVHRCTQLHPFHLLPVARNT